jgi:shikimate kinase
MRRLSLIGMAGIGKSYWSMRLEAHGYRRFCCDDLIAEKLGKALIRSDGTTMSMGEWMGFPFNEGYREREHTYLTYEIEVLNEVLDYLEHPERNPDENIVVDTTGSVIYDGNGLLEKLRRHTTVVYFSTPDAVQKQLLNAYISSPHPMLWKDLFRKAPQETNMQALVRCYPQLLIYRTNMYELFADVTIDYYRCRERNFGVRELLEVVVGTAEVEETLPGRL